MGQYRKDSKRTWGFTLIELILVLGLVTTLGALAAPQFTDVFDHSKDQADIAQMDQLLVAFQLEQAPFYEGHDGKYDMLKDENVKYKWKNGEIVDTIVKPAKARLTLQAFLNNVVKPGSDVYMEGAKCVKTEKTHVIKNGKQRSVFEAKLTKKNTCLKIICRADKNESSIELPLPGLNKPIDDVYSDGEMVNGTWMIIGDDDRLRADYVEDYLKKDDKTKKKLDEKLKKDKTYKFKTAFRIETEMDKEPEEIIQTEVFCFDPDWIAWLPNNTGGTAHDMIIKTKLAKDEKIKVYVEYDGPGNGANNISGYLNYGTGGIRLLVPPSGKDFNMRLEFTNQDQETFDRYYDLDVIKTKDGSNFDPAGNTGEEGYIEIVKGTDEDKDKDKGNKMWFHYKYNSNLSNDPSPGSEIITTVIPGYNYPTTDFYTGFVFNIVQSNEDREEKEYPNYDFLAIHYNESKKITELLYLEKKGKGNTLTQIGEGIELVDFQYNHNYTIELNVTKEKAVYVTLYDETKTLLKSKKIIKVNNSLHPVIGYYMNQTVELQKNISPKLNEKAVAEIDEVNEINRIPLVTYEDDSSIGPRLIIISRPEFYPYETEVTPPDGSGGENQGSGNDDENEDDDGGTLVTYAMPIISPYTNNPEKPYTVESKTEENEVEYTWVRGLENDSIDDVDWDNRVLRLEEGESGWLWAREYKGDKFALEDKWVKKPWVGKIIHNKERFEIEESFPSYKIKYVSSEELKFDNFVVMMRKNTNDWKSATEMQFDSRLEVSFESKINYSGKQVSAVINRQYIPSAQTDKTAPEITVEVFATYSPIGNSGKTRFMSTVYFISDEPVVLSEGLEGQMMSDEWYSVNFSERGKLSFTATAIDDPSNSTLVMVDLDRTFVYPPFQGK
ncbi:hypothetical protein SANA_31250 [Gottschalkiaceae bacterium SANA]|nr:hypothetical protein SANA_31250 [Gottschalkiaceae bacterium SANA]